MTVYFSKTYTTSGGIAAGADSAENFISEADQYGNGPFDQITVINSDVVPLRINIDGNTANGLKLLPNSLMSGRDLRFNSFTITNLDGSTAHTAGTVYILIENTRFPRRD